MGAYSVRIAALESSYDWTRGAFSTGFITIQVTQRMRFLEHGQMIPKLV